MRKGTASRTAMMVAFWRTLADMGVTTIPRFADPGARKLLSGPVARWMLARADRLAADPTGPGARRLRPWIDGIVLRVAFIDAVITAARAKQVVIVGAGLDTRAWRLEALRDAHVLELDHPATQAYKRAHAEALGAPFARHTYVPIDFTRDDLDRALRAAGHDPTEPTVWVWEGVIMYLDDAALRATLAALRRLSAPGSTLVAHYHEPSDHDRLVRRLAFRWLGEPQIGLRRREVMRREVESAGFTVQEDAGIAEQAARVGAPLPATTALRVSRILLAT